MMTNTTNNATINNTNTMEVITMKNYKEMKWVEVVAYAKELGINTYQKKRPVIEAEIEALFIKKEEVIDVNAGDMGSDKYYPEEQKAKKSEVEEKIKKAIQTASFNATYNNVPVKYIMSKALHTIIKYNLSEQLRTEEVIQKVIENMVKKDVLYKCNQKFYGVRA